MKWLSLLLLCVGTLCSITNTTAFWQQKLNISAGDMHFQAYSGIPYHIQDSNKSTGIVQQDNHRCSISFTVKWAQT